MGVFPCLAASDSDTDETQQCAVRNMMGSGLDSKTETEAVWAPLGYMKEWQVGVDPPSTSSRGHISSRSVKSLGLRGAQMMNDGRWKLSELAVGVDDDIFYCPWVWKGRTDGLSAVYIRTVEEGVH